jgi:hypothetical protein
MSTPSRSRVLAGLMLTVISPVSVLVAATSS